MAIRLQIVDKDNSIIQEDILNVFDGDIILCQINKEFLDHKQTIETGKRIQEVFKRASKQAYHDKIVVLTYDSNINFKILKINTE